ncbi:MAG: hypothetical protein KDD40_02825 [Bdellovibrionales bacterium]|nr:hypothetical protein [Bdellovibrionales bacterium]
MIAVEEATLPKGSFNLVRAAEIAWVLELICTNDFFEKRTEQKITSGVGRN